MTNKCVFFSKDKTSKNPIPRHPWMVGYHTMLGFCLGDFTKSLRAKVAENQRHIVAQWRLVNLPPVCLPNLNYQSNVSVVGLGASVNHMDEPM